MICDHFILKSSLVKYHVNSSSQCSLICCKGVWEKLRNIKKKTRLVDHTSYCQGINCLLHKLSIVQREWTKCLMTHLWKRSRWLVDFIYRSVKTLCIMSGLKMQLKIRKNPRACHITDIHNEGVKWVIINLFSAHERVKMNNRISLLDP